MFPSLDIAINREAEGTRNNIVTEETQSASERDSTILLFYERKSFHLPVTGALTFSSVAVFNEIFTNICSLQSLFVSCTL